MRRGLGLVRYSGALRALAKMRRLAKRCRLEGGFGVGFGHGAGPAGEEWGEREGRVTESPRVGWKSQETARVPNLTCRGGSFVPS